MQNDQPKTTNDLLNKIGGAGNYQRNILVIFCFIWLVTGCILMGTPFTFLNSQFQCKEKGLMTKDCHGYVCSLPEQQWKNYHPDQNQIDSIATDFGPFQCSQQFYLDLATTSTYFGAFIGYILFSFYADNFGRRSSLLVAWGITTIGSILLVVSQNIYMAAGSMFLLGAGSDASINLCFYFLGEVVESKTRQKYSILIQPWFATGALVITFVFYLIKNWRIVCIITITGPSVALMIFVFFYIEETPLFLFRKGIRPTLKALNRIGKINRGIKQVLDEEDVQKVLQEQVEEKQFHQIITIIDLFRFKSLRTTSICLCFLNFAVVVLYYGPVLTIENIGFNIYISSLVVQLSELIVYVPLYNVIDKLPRSTAGYVLFSLTGICCFILLFLQKPDDCDFCAASIIQLIVVFAFRLFLSCYFITLYVYMVQLYPARSRAIGNGFVSAIGTLGSTTSPLILGVLQRNSISVYIFFLLMVIIGLGNIPFLPETLNMPLKDEIDEILHQKEQVKKKRGTEYSKEIQSLAKSHKQPTSAQRLDHMIKSQ